MASYQYIYVMKDLTKTYLGKGDVLKNIYLSFFPGAKIGVIGYNGSGKSTLLRIMAGLDKDYTGEAWAAENIRIGYLAQEPKLDPTKNVYDNILESLAEKRDLLVRYNEINAKFAEEMTNEQMDALIIEQGELQEKIDILNAWDLEREISIAMDALRCPDKNADINRISGGEKRRVALCKLLLERPDMLLLDEPTNHLDAESVSWLENYLKEYQGTVVLITHDRYFLDNVTGWILELDRGEGIPWQGNYSSWLEQKHKRLSQEEKVESNKQKQLKREFEWVSQSAKARQAKSKHRLSQYEKLRDEEKVRNVGTASIVIPDGPRLGDNVLEVINIRKSYERDLFSDLSFILPPAAILGIIGPNGVGKTSILKMITGQEKIDDGIVKIGESVVLGYVDQARDALKNDNNVWQEISEGQEDIELGKHKIKSRAYCAAFNFKGSDQQKVVGQLSGGERNRVHLAKMLKTGANFLLLDEPTNDLDVDTLRSLEEALLDFSGCAIIVSHDRWFLDRVTTHILSFEEEKPIFFEGNYSDYDQDRRRRLGIAGDDPIKYKHKKFMS